METYEKINHLIEESGMSKKEFVNRVLELEPKLKVTGETPSSQTIYRYLNGSREIKVEILPYFAEVLNIKEQDFFEFELGNSSIDNFRNSKELKEVLDLLQYLPVKAIKNLKDNLNEYKKMYEKEFFFKK